MMTKLKVFAIACSMYFLAMCSKEDVAMSTQLTKAELIDQIANNLQSLATVNLGPIQLMQIRQSIQDLHYSYQELQQLDNTVEDRIASQKDYQYYSENMYVNLIQAMQNTEKKSYTLTDYTIY